MSKQDSETQKFTFSCTDCGKSGDVWIREAGTGFCCNCYEIRASNMRRTADGLIYDHTTNAYRSANEHERHAQAQVMKSLYARFTEGKEKAREGLKSIAKFVR